MSLQHSVRLTFMLIGGALAGKLLGFAREIVMARLIGTTMTADVLRGSVTAVLLPIGPLQGDLVPSVLIPLHRAWCQEGRSVELSTALAILFTLVAAVLGLTVYVLAAPWVGVLVSGFAPEAQALTVSFTKTMALAMPASALGANLSAVEIAIGRSRITMLRASVHNLGILIGIVVMSLTGQMLAIAWSFVIAFNMIAIFGAVSLWRAGEISLGSVKIASVWEAGSVFLRRAKPLLLVPVAEQGNILLERLIASRGFVGTLASLDYARTLTESMLYLVSQPIGFVVLTRDLGGRDKVRQQFEAVAGPVLACVVPTSIFVAVFADDLVWLIFAGGAFDAHAVALTSGALSAIALGLWATTLGYILLRMINAAGRNGTAALVMVLALTANVLVNLAAGPSLGAVGLGLGETARGGVLLCGTALALGCAGLLLRRLILILPAALSMVLVAAVVQHSFATPFTRIAFGMPIFGLGVAAWFAIYLPQPSRAIAAALWRPFHRSVSSPTRP